MRDLQLVQDKAPRETRSCGVRTDITEIVSLLVCWVGLLYFCNYEYQSGQRLKQLLYNF